MKRADKGSINLGGTDAVAGTFLKFASFIIGQNPGPEIAKYPRRGGDVTFSIPLVDFGNDDHDIEALGKMLSTRFYANFIGELILRSNAQQFLDHIAEEALYEVDVGMWRHEHFGVGTDQERIYYIVHASRLSEVLNERLGEAFK